MSENRDSYLPKLVELHLKMCEESEECHIDKENLSETQVEALIEEVRRLRKAKKSCKDKNLERIKKIVDNEQT